MVTVKELVAARMSYSTLHPVLFITFVLALSTMSFPLGSNRDWIWPLFSVVYFTVTMFLLLDIKNTASTIAIKSVRISIIAFACLIIWIAIQRYGIPPLVPQITIDRFLTFNDLMKTITYTCIFFSAISVVTTRTRLLILIYALLLAALVQAMIGSIATLQSIQQSSRGTFPNPNHLAGFLEMCLGLGVGVMIAMQDHQKRTGREKYIAWLEAITGPKARLRLILLILVIGLVMGASRMGNIAFFSSILISAAFLAVVTRRFSKMTAIFLASILIIDVAIIGKYFGIERVAQRLQTMTLETETRDNINAYSWRIFKDYPIAGTGAGTYELIFTQYRGPEVAERITNAENDYMEFLVELGIIGCLPLLTLVGFGLAGQVQMMKHSSYFTRGIAFGCFMGTVALLLHSATDFNLQIPSNAALFTLLLALPQAMQRHEIR